MSDSIQHPIDYFKSEQKVRKTSISSSDQLPGKALREIQRNRWKTTIATLRQEASALQEQDHVDKPLSAKERWLKKKKELLEEDAALQCPPREKSYRDRLIEFYTIHNPEKLSTVDRTLETYNGKEEELFTRLKEKYLQVFPSLIERKRQFPLTNSSNTTVYLDMSIGNSFIGRIVIRLLDEIVPLAAENFKLLCTGEVASDLHFKGSYFHRIVRNFMIQGGDITKGDGTGGVSAFRSTPKANMWGNFKDETFLPHDSVGLLSMANHGKNTNGSQFFITTKDAPHLDNKHVVFGEVIEGLDVVDKIQVVPVNKNSRPLEGYEVKIEDCGQLG